MDHPQQTSYLQPELLQKLGDLDLWERDITVLTVHRGTVVIPNPRKGVVLEAGDDRADHGDVDRDGGGHRVARRSRRREGSIRIGKAAIDTIALTRQG